MSPTRRTPALARRLAEDRSGATAVFVGLAMMAVLGFVALGIDVGSWYSLRRQTQNAADSAAFSAATAMTAGAGDAAAQARAVAAAYGFTQGVDGATVTVNTPPAAGAYASDTAAVEVILTRPAPHLFTRLFGVGASAIAGRAVGHEGAPGTACVLALHSTASASALETGSANVQLNGCSLFSNSSSTAAFELKGAASVSALSVGMVGGYSVSNNAVLSTTQGVKTGQQALADPYANVPIPSYSGCTYNSASLSSGTYSTSNTSPTVFCNGLTLNSGVKVTLNPGVYVIDRGALQINGGATLTGTGVTLVLTSSTGSNYATASINGNSTVNLSAPTTGPTAGMVFYQDRNAPSGGSDTFNGGSTQVLSGAVYFPNQSLVFTGGSSTATSGCTQLVSGSVVFEGNSTLALNCAGTGVRPAGNQPVRLVE
jgi:hypothetical protein